MFLLAFLVIAIGLGLSVGFALATTGFIFVWASGVTNASIIPQQMDDGIGSFVLLAIPFFVLAGLAMAHGGLGARIAELVRALVGHVPGGSLLSIVASMYIFSGLSGSKIADMAAVGTTLADFAETHGYPRSETAAVLSASAVMGETIPPSTVLLVLGSISTLSIAALFAAGVLPAAVLAVCLMLVIYFRARRNRSRRHLTRFRWQAVGPSAVMALPALLLPIVLVGGIVTGISTATEASALAVIYGVVLAMLVYRELTVRQLIRTVVESASMSGMVLFIVASASAFSWTLSIQRVPFQIAATVVQIGGNRFVFLIVAVIVLACLGMLLEGLPALLILAPILLPAATAIGIDPLQFGIVLIIALSLGVFAPPIGIGVYGACLVARTSVESVVRPLATYWAVLAIGLVLIAAIPAITLAVPRALGLVP